MKLNELISRAKLFIKVKDYEMAINYLKKALDLNPDSIYILLLIGSTYQLMNKNKEAIQYYEKIIEKNSKSIEAYNNLGVIHKNLEEYEKSIYYFKEALKINHKKSDIYYNLGNVYKILNKFPEAIENFEKAIKLNLKFVNAYNNLGTVYEILGRYNDAINTYQKALKIDPNNLKLHYNLGVVLEKNNNIERSQFHYKRAVELNPNFIEAHNNLGIIYEKKGDLENAKNCYMDSLSINPNYIKAMNNLAIVYEKLNNKEKAIEYYKKALAIDKNYLISLKNLGKLYSNIGMYKDAEAIFEKILEINDSDFDSYFHLGKIEENIDKNRAIDIYKNILKTDPTNIDIRKNLGNLYLSMNMLNEAKEQFKKIEKLDPNDIDNKLKIVELAEKEETYLDVIKILNDILLTDEKNIKALHKLGEINLKINETEKAVEIFKKLKEINKDDQKARLNLAKAYKNLGQFNKAMEEIYPLLNMEFKENNENDLNEFNERLKFYEEMLEKVSKENEIESEKIREKLRDVDLESILDDKYYEKLEKENKEKLEKDELEKNLTSEGDTTPIISIGDTEPFYAIQEEEEDISTSEAEDENEEEEEEIPTNSYFSLLKDQETYGDMPYNSSRAINQPQIKFPEKITAEIVSKIPENIPISNQPSSNAQNKLLHNYETLQNIEQVGQAKSIPQNNVEDLSNSLKDLKEKINSISTTVPQLLNQSNNQNKSMGQGLNKLQDNTLANPVQNLQTNFEILTEKLSNILDKLDSNISDSKKEPENMKSEKPRNEDSSLNKNDQEKDIERDKEDLLEDYFEDINDFDMSDLNEDELLDKFLNEDIEDTLDNIPNIDEELEKKLNNDLKEEDNTKKPDQQNLNNEDNLENLKEEQQQNKGDLNDFKNSEVDDLLKSLDDKINLKEEDEDFIDQPEDNKNFFDEMNDNLKLDEEKDYDDIKPSENILNDKINNETDKNPNEKIDFADKMLQNDIQKVLEEMKDEIESNDLDFMDDIDSDFFIKDEAFEKLFGNKNNKKFEPVNESSPLDSIPMDRIDSNDLGIGDEALNIEEELEDLDNELMEDYEERIGTGDDFLEDINESSPLDSIPMDRIDSNDLGIGDEALNIEEELEDLDNELMEDYEERIGTGDDFLEDINESSPLDSIPMDRIDSNDLGIGDEALNIEEELEDLDNELMEDYEERIGTGDDFLEDINESSPLDSIPMDRIDSNDLGIGDEALNIEEELEDLDNGLMEDYEERIGTGDDFLEDINESSPLDSIPMDRIDSNDLGIGDEALNIEEELEDLDNELMEDYEERIGTGDDFLEDINESSPLDSIPMDTLDNKDLGIGDEALNIEEELENLEGIDDNLNYEKIKNDFGKKESLKDEKQGKSFLDLPDLPEIDLEEEFLEKEKNKNLSFSKDFDKDIFSSNDIILDNIFDFPPLENFNELDKKVNQEKKEKNIKKSEQKNKIKEQINVTTKVIKGIEIDFFE